ncbi:MAG: FecR domain-containing protein [Leptospiraceae bacterium]|nr:FecR domain-containing protein [Leptospiraceae bacterium]
MKFFSGRDLTIIALLLFNAGLFGFLFYYDLNKAVSGNNNEEIGTIIFKKNGLQRKYDSQVVWKDLYQNVPLKNRDTVRTFEDSDAVIILKDGTEIQLDENSLVYLDVKNQIPNINFNGGAIQVTNPKNSVSLSSNNKTILMEQGNYKLEKNSPDNLNLIVDSGKAKLDDNGVSKEVNSSNSASISSNKMEISQLPFVMQSPPNQKKIFTEPGNDAVNFTWETKVKIDTLRLEVSRNKDFSDLVTSSIPSSNSSKVRLDPGAYFWRLSGNSENGKKEVSEIRKFLVVATDPMLLFSPERNAVIGTENGNLPTIHFSWSENRVDSKYKLEIANNQSFSGSHKSFVLDSNSYSVSDLQEGTYYWKVSTLPVSGAKPSLSKIRIFTIKSGKVETTEEKSSTASEETTKPEDNKEATTSKSEVTNMAPNNKVVIVQKNSSIPFQWEKLEGVKTYQFKIFDSKTNKQVYTTNLGTNQLKFTKFQVLNEGKFSWEITPMLADGKKGKSSTANFTVVSKDKLKNLKPDEIQILSPETIYRD